MQKGLQIEVNTAVPQVTTWGWLHKVSLYPETPVLNAEV